MKNVIKFTGFVFYTITLFLVNHYFLLGIAFAFQILFMIILPISNKSAIKSMVHLLPFILFTAVINGIFMNMESAILIGIRLVMVCHMTYLLGKTTTAMEIAKVVQTLLYPLTWFKVNTNNIGMIVSIGITFIPIMKQEIENIQNSLLAKGFSLSFPNKIKYISYIMGPLMYSLLKRINQIEDSLKAKAYREEISK